MSKLLLDEKPLVILPQLARQIGLNEAIVLQQIHYWMQHPELGKTHEGRKWIRNTYDQWAENFPFSKSTTRRTLDSLRESGLVLVENLNQHAYDQTNWYTIDYDRLSNLSRPDAQNEQPDYRFV